MSKRGRAKSVVTPASRSSGSSLALSPQPSPALLHTPTSDKRGPRAAPSTESPQLRPPSGGGRSATPEPPAPPAPPSTEQRHGHGPRHTKTRRARAAAEGDDGAMSVLPARRSRGRQRAAPQRDRRAIEDEPESLHLSRWQADESAVTTSSERAEQLLEEQQRTIDALVHQVAALRAADAQQRARVGELEQQQRPRQEQRGPVPPHTATSPPSAHHAATQRLAHERDQLVEENEALRAEVAARAGEVRRLEERTHSLEDECGALRAAVGSRNEELAATQALLAGKEAHLQHLLNTRSAAEQALRSLQAPTEKGPTMDERLLAAARERDRAEARASRAEAQCKRLSAKLSAQRARVRAMEGEVSSMRTAFEQIREQSVAMATAEPGGSGHRAGTAAADQAQTPHSVGGAADARVNAVAGTDAPKEDSGSAVAPAPAPAPAAVAVAVAGKEAFWVEAMHALRTDVAARCQLIGDLVSAHARARPAAGMPRRRAMRASAPAPPAEGAAAGGGAAQGALPGSCGHGHAAGDAQRVTVAQSRVSERGVRVQASLPVPCRQHASEARKPSWAVAPSRGTAPAPSPAPAPAPAPAPTRAAASQAAERSTDAELRRQRLRAEARFASTTHSSSVSLSDSTFSRTHTGVQARPTRTADAAAGPPSLTAIDSRSSETGSLGSVADQVLGGGTRGRDRGGEEEEEGGDGDSSEQRQQRRRRQRHAQGRAEAGSLGGQGSHVFDTEQSTPTAVGDASGADDDDSSAYRILNEVLQGAR